MVRRYEDLRAVLFHASNQLQELTTVGRGGGSANVEKTKR